MTPLWIDLQVNGFGGVDFNGPGLTEEKVREVVGRLRDEGTAGFCPTFVTGDPDCIERNLRTVEAARRRDAECAERILGYHLEGPFISREPGAVGAHDPKWVRPPDVGLFERFQAAAHGNVRIVTVAAELPGAAEFTREVSKRGVVVSCGHQMAHTPEQLGAMAAAGARALTHLGNGVPNLLPRHDNVIWAGLAEDRLTVMFIPDGRHLPLHLLKVYTRAVPLDRLVAVTDASYPAGMPPGHYTVFGSDAVLEPDGLLHNPERQCLVGSTATMAQAMAILSAPPVGLTHEQCLRIGRENPLRLIGRRDAGK
jgi:N-acetylglucosamine-6-phosphate deacetylase